MARIGSQGSSMNALLVIGLFTAGSVGELGVLEPIEAPVRALKSPELMDGVV
jgi:hypothetical protein